MKSIAVRIKQEWLSTTWADGAWLVFCAGLFYATKWAADRIIADVPGHAGMFWIPVLFLARAKVGKTGSATITALVGAALWNYPFTGGIYNFITHTTAGVVVDVLNLDAARLRRLRLALLSGVLCNMVKFPFHKIPIFGPATKGPFKAWGMGHVVLFHLLFGALGGLLGWALVCAVTRKSAHGKKDGVENVENAIKT